MILKKLNSSKVIKINNLNLIELLYLRNLQFDYIEFVNKFYLISSVLPLEDLNLYYTSSIERTNGRVKVLNEIQYKDITLYTQSLNNDINNLSSSIINIRNNLHEYDILISSSIKNINLITLYSQEYTLVMDRDIGLLKSKYNILISNLNNSLNIRNITVLSQNYSTIVYEITLIINTGGPSDSISSNVNKYTKNQNYKLHNNIHSIYSIFSANEFLSNNLINPINFKLTKIINEYNGTDYVRKSKQEKLSTVFKILSEIYNNKLTKFKLYLNNTIITDKGTQLYNNLYNSLKYFKLQTSISISLTQELYSISSGSIGIVQISNVHTEVLSLNNQINVIYNNSYKIINKTLGSDVIIIKYFPLYNNIVTNEWIDIPSNINIPIVVNKYTIATGSN